MMKKLGKEFYSLEALLEEFEKCVEEQKEQLKHLKVEDLQQLG